MTKIDLHADDYALSESSDNDILALCKQGKLDSISVIPNLQIFDAAAQKFLKAKKDFPKEVKVAVHLNVMEGKCLADKSLVPNLVDERGFFNVSWGKLLVFSINPFKRKTVRSQLKAEILAQIKRAAESGLCDTSALRVDSHQHPHMIPVFFDALTDALAQLGTKPEYVRNSQDPILCYMTAPALFKTYSPANIVKCLILNHYSRKVRRWQKKNGLKTNLLCGVFFSGHMDSKRVKKVLPSFEKKCQARGADLEVLFHPGTMLQNELTPEFTKPGFNEFHFSQGRKIEFEALQELR
ncbi:MAG: ChbG/HpnK family deacetylase [Treponema sp.]|nr:ChbG/HpnK family deacetylase [Treponema sp.]